jgi:hypothetical protein
MLQYLVFLGAAAQLLGILSYVKKTLKGENKPNRITWLMWSVAPLIATFAAITDGVGWSVLPVFMAGFGPLLVFIASFINKNSYWRLGIFDYLCGLFSLLALILWGITKEPNIAILFAIASDGSAAIPTLIKAWKYPETESVGPYATGLFSALTSFVAIKIWNFSSLAFPLYLVMICALLIVSVYSRQIFRKNNYNLCLYL